MPDENTEIASLRRQIEHSTEAVEAWKLANTLASAAIELRDARIAKLTRVADAARKLTIFPPEPSEQRISRVSAAYTELDAALVALDAD